METGIAPNIGTVACFVLEVLVLGLVVSFFALMQHYRAWSMTERKAQRAKMGPKGA